MKDLLSILLVTWAFTFSHISYGANPYLRPNNTWISISGEVEAVKPNQFTLNYGEGTVTVEMDDGDRDADAYKLIKGDKVTVAGFIDRDLFEKTKIEAGIVYVENIGTTFYSSSADEEGPNLSYYYPTPTPGTTSSALLYGTVSDIDGKTFSMKTSELKVTVDTSAMSYNPLDAVGYPQIKKGDYVSVSGKMTKKFILGNSLEAKSVTKYYEKPASKSKAH